jgi:hypothetical protein
MKYENMNIVLRTEERKRERERATEIYLSAHPWEAIPMWNVTWHPQHYSIHVRAALVGLDCDLQVGQRNSEFLLNGTAVLVYPGLHGTIRDIRITWP